ncbi:MAG: UbiA family prenyltransferase [Candidatus Wallbacteria bacterium]|nr:UbiA family prenyltransferase [Candidatus Wallbacteria bacterium]
MNTFHNTVKYLENADIPFYSFLSAWFSAILLRSLLEKFSSCSPLELQTLGHFIAFYSASFLAASLILHFITAEHIVKVLRVTLPSALLLCVAPLVDLAVSSGKGYNMSYLLPGEHDDLVFRFFTFFGDFPTIGGSRGIRVEIALFLVLCFLYARIKGCGMLRSLSASFLVYCKIFLLAASPFVLRFIYSSSGCDFNYSEPLLTRYLAIVAVVLAIITAMRANRDYFLMMVKDLRPLRILHYLLMLAIGLACGAGTGKLSIDPDLVFRLALISVSLTLCAVFAIAENNFHDLSIDRISSPNRPLCLGCDSQQYMAAGRWCFIVSLLTAAAAGYATLFTVLLFSGNYHLYSAPPVRFKRVPVASKLVISLNSWALMLLGYSFAEPSLWGFPPLLTLFVLIMYTGAANFIDIKDFEGDAAAGVKTLPVLIGLEQAKFLVACSFFVTCSAFFYPLRHQPAYALPFALSGMAFYFLISRKSYREKPVLLLYLALMSYLTFLIATGRAVF